MPASVEILDELAGPDGSEHPKAKHEFYQSSIEVITGICDTVSEVVDDLNGTLAEVSEVAARRQVALIGGALHPTANWHELLVTPSPRYQDFARTIAWPARRSMCHGIHYHVGVRSADHSLAISRALAVYMPLFIALSGSSPYWHGTDTGLQSARTKVFEGMPTTGLPPKLADWDEFTELMTVLIHAGTIRSVRELWWDIRPHPGFGTVEIRVTDCMGTMREIAALAALAQCLVEQFSRLLDAGQTLPELGEWVLKDNKWRACRWGLDAQVIVDANGNTAPVTSLVAEAIADLAGVAEELGCADELRSMMNIVDQHPGSVRQRAQYALRNDFNDVVDMLIAEWESNQPYGWRI